jgi:hypothetical protein
MGRPITAKVEETKRRDGTTYYWTRVMVDGERTTVPLGDERDGDTRIDVDGKVKDLLEDLRLGRWEPDLPDEPKPWAIRGHVTPLFKITRSSKIRPGARDRVQRSRESRCHLPDSVPNW